MPGTCAIEPLVPTLAAAVEGMTFPAYRHLLSLEPAPRDPRLGDPRPVRPFGAVARIGEALVGLALAEQRLDAPADAQLLSLYVAEDVRRTGIATRLVEAIERGARAAGVERLRAEYVTGRPQDGAFERVLAKRGWDRPVARTVTVDFTPARAASAPWFERVRRPAGFEIFAWADLPEVERREMRRSHAERPWIARGLEFWIYEPLPIDRVSSVGARWRGTVVGWVINHRMDAGLVRFTCAFMRPDLARRALLVPLMRESVGRLLADGRTRRCTFVASVDNAAMVGFIRKRCAPWADLVGETRASEKRLVQAS